MKKNIFILLTILFSLVSCKPVEEQEPLIDDDKYLTSIITSGSYFEEAFPQQSGYQFNSQSNIDFLKNYLCSNFSEIEQEGLLDSINVSKLQVSNYQNVSYLQIGSGSGEGYLLWNSSVNIYRVEIDCKCYCKYDSYHDLLIVDNAAHVLINTEEFDLSYDGINEPNSHHFYIDFTNPVSSFKIANLYQRIFVEKITIWWDK